MIEERCELVVVGAGPAGSYTAKTAAENGVQVLLIERNPEIGLPLRCAEGVTTEIEQYVEIDRRWVCAAVSGMILYGPDGTELRLSVSERDEMGYTVDRGLFDKALAQQAAHAGADVRVKTRASGVIHDAGYVTGVYATDASGEPMRILADVVVGADGVESKVGQWGGIDTRLPLPDVGICAQFLMCDIDVNAEYFETYFGDQIAPKGFAWIFPKGRDSANVGLGISGDTSGENYRALDYLNAFVRTKFPHGEILGRMYGAVPLSGPVYETVANGLLLVGDAARHVNPLNGGGILYALHGGALAGEVIAKAVHEKDVSKRRLREYERRWRRAFGGVLEAGLKMKKILLQLDNQDLMHFFQSVAGEIRVKEYSERACMKELLRRNPRLLFSILRLIF